MPSNKKKKSPKPIQVTSYDHYDASHDELAYSMQTLSISCAPQQNYTQILADFLNQRGSFSKESPDLGSKAQKLSLWQAILVKVGLCYDGFGTPSLPGLARPSNFPKVVLPLPTSLRGCKTLIKKYVFLNIVDMKAGRTRVSRRKSVPFELFSSPRELIRYTVDHRRYFPLGEAKEQLLNPLLWDMHYRGARPRLLYDEDDDDDSDKY